MAIVLLILNFIYKLLLSSILIAVMIPLTIYAGVVVLLEAIFKPKNVNKIVVDKQKGKTKDAHVVLFTTGIKVLAVGMIAMFIESGKLDSVTFIKDYSKYIVPTLYVIDMLIIAWYGPLKLLSNIKKLIKSPVSLFATQDKKMEKNGLIVTLISIGVLGLGFVYFLLNKEHYVDGDAWYWWFNEFFIYWPLLIVSGAMLAIQLFWMVYGFLALTKIVNPKIYKEVKPAAEHEFKSAAEREVKSVIEHEVKSEVAPVEHTENNDQNEG